MRTQVLFSFLEAAEHDPRMAAVHISVYVSLFRRWCAGGGKDPVRFSRGEIMQGAKVRGRGTYHYCMRQLHECGYIRYIPSHDPVRGSKVFLEGGP